MEKNRRRSQPRSMYHSVMTYLTREQMLRVMNHYTDYISGALYIYHDKDIVTISEEDILRLEELKKEHEHVLEEINAINKSLGNAQWALKNQSFENDDAKKMYQRLNVSAPQRRRRSLEKKADKVSSDIKELEKAKALVGTPKSPHYHILIKCYGAHTAEAVRNWFYRFHVTEKVEKTVEVENPETGKKEEQKVIDEERVNTLNQIAESVAACRDYLTHKNEPEVLGKHVYDISEVREFANGWKCFNKAGRSSDDVLDLVDRLTNGESLRDLARDYGRDFIINYQKYRTFALVLESQEDHARDLSDRENDIIRHAEKHDDGSGRYYYDILNMINEANLIRSKCETILGTINRNK